jgi:hypothetical protein
MAGSDPAGNGRWRETQFLGVSTFTLCRSANLVSIALARLVRVTIHAASVAKIFGAVFTINLEISRCRTLLKGRYRLGPVQL